MWRQILRSYLLYKSADMKITYQGTTAPATLFTIANQDNRDGIVFHDRDHTRHVQEDPLAWGDYESTLPNDNRRNAFSFSVDKKHTSDDAAAAYLFDFPDSLPSSGILSVIIAGTTRQMSDACLKQVRLTALDGCSTVLTFTFTGGAFTTVHSTEPEVDAAWQSATAI